MRESIVKAANEIANDSTYLLDKSGQNNVTTLSFYFNLRKGTNTLDLVLKGDVTRVIRNFVLKFQYPNPYTTDLLRKNLESNTIIAPLRVVCRLLVYWSLLEQSKCVYLSYNEIKYYFFCNPSSWEHADVSFIRETIEKIKRSRSEGVDLSSSINRGLDWKQCDRQSRELIKTITYASRCFKTSKDQLNFSMLGVLDSNFSDEMKFISELLSYNSYWSCGIEELNNKGKSYADKSYEEYMDIKGIIQLSSKQVVGPVSVDDLPLQQIFFGAPGTGKSYSINCNACITDDNSIRTTFHPDCDYSTFVGCYKPALNDASGELTYRFVPQAFTEAYVRAWLKPDEPFFLIIEEINRGNCAQIFGDVFQLLDRDDRGYSAYRIVPDRDLQRYLQQQFADSDIGDASIKSGKKMQLPPNLHIWATMNTSDQSLFPIDSAFKRRWDWRYVPIDCTDRGHYIDCGGGRRYVWASFVRQANERIEAVTQSEDKKLGYWFAARKGHDAISSDRFVSKVVFYLWNDVFKDCAGEAGSIFTGNCDSFHRFFTDGGEVNADLVAEFLDGLGVERLEPADEPQTDA